jgi:formylglycine-generating enzyme required for sulfatase activity
MRYDLTLTGPGGEVLKRSISGGQTVSLMAALGNWHIDAKAYQQNVLAGTGSLAFKVGPGGASVKVPMYMAGPCYVISIPAITHGTVSANFSAAFPGTAITLTVTPDTAYTGGTVTYRDGSDHAIAGPPYTFAMPEADITVSAVFAGTKITYTGSISFAMVWVPGGILFPTGTDDPGTPATVANAYEIGETEVTYELWHTVRNWAEGNGYIFDNNPGQEGSGGTLGSDPTPSGEQEPVTMVTWFDAVVWLNALTDWYNNWTGSELERVYYYDSGYTGVAKNSDPSSNFVKEIDTYSYASAYAKPGATGFRLPTSNEWELAARWRGSDPTNTVSGYTNPYFTKGDSASGATAYYNDATATGLVAWYSGNASGQTHAVKGKDANALGLYDMSGNVYELCFDWYPGSIDSYRLARGGSLNIPTYSLRVGDVYNSIPDSGFTYIGFRLARTAQ